MLRAAEDHYRTQARLAAMAVLAAGRTWDRLDPVNLDGWVDLVGRLSSTVAATQLLAARDADPYLAAVLDEENVRADAEGRVRAAAFVGVAGDGRPVGSLLYEPLIGVKEAIGQGASTQDAMASGRSSLGLMVATAVQDAGRAAVSTAIAARPKVAGYVRMLNLPSCSRCVPLAGKWFRWNDGFERHPKCFPAGVVVSGPETQAATRRWYEGELVVITTASGQRLPATGNHPILTDRGWVPANLIQEGDYVLRSTLAEGATPLVVPDEHQVPARIEDLWRPDGMVTLRQVPTAAEDFHGDGGHGDVDVVLADRLLRDGMQPAAGELAQQVQLAWRIAQSLDLAGQRSPEESLDRLLAAADSLVSSGGLSAALVGSHASGAHLASRGVTAGLDSLGFDASADHVAAHPIAAAEAVLALARTVGVRDLVGGNGQVPPRWDAPAGPFTVESRGTYASRGEDLRLRLAGQVSADRVVQAERVQWSGHVYNLSSVEGWYSANGLIVSNCDCRHIPASEDVAGDLRTDPLEAIRSGQVTGMSQADTKAIVEDGADAGQVINAHRGMSTEQVFGQRLKVTTEGTTRRGLAGVRLGARNADAVKLPGQRYRRATAPRLRPESIYKIAESREDAIRLLKRNGYII